MSAVIYLCIGSLYAMYVKSELSKRDAPVEAKQFLADLKEWEAVHGFMALVALFWPCFVLLQLVTFLRNVVAAGLFFLTDKGDGFLSAIYGRVLMLTYRMDVRYRLLKRHLKKRSKHCCHGH